MDGTMERIGTILGSLSPRGTVSGILSSTGNITGDLTIPTYIDVDLYDGPTEITPGEEPQVLNTQNKTLVNRVVVNPIPPNYGKIIWDGRRIRIE